MPWPAEQRTHIHGWCILRAYNGATEGRLCGGLGSGVSQGFRDVRFVEVDGWGFVLRGKTSSGQDTMMW